MTGLLCREIKAAELQELAMMAETPKADAWDATESLIVRAVNKQIISHAFDRLLPVKTALFLRGDRGMMRP
jgi:hypothetical protein